MPACYLRRPAFLWLVSYLGLLCLLRAWGWFPKPPWRPPAPREGAAAAVRERVLESFALRLEPEHGAMLGGIVLGELARLSPGLRRAFRDAGAMHLLVASGSNVAFALALAAGLASLLGCSRRAAIAAGLAGAALYTAVVGGDAPILRGFLMTACASAGFFAGRNPGAFQGLVLACWALALWDPPSVFGAGFQMSFAACLGLVAALPGWRAPPRWPAPLRYAAGIFLASLAAQAAIAPVIAAHFRQLSVTALFSNLFLVPMTGLLMAGGFLLAAADWLWPAAAGRVAAPLEAALAVFESLVRWFAAWPLRWRVPPPGPLFLAAYYACALALWTRPGRDKLV